MRLLLATNHLGLGGSESYLLTVAEQLDRLGHEALVFAPEGGNGRAVAAERGIAVVAETAELPDDREGIVVQDAGVSLELSARYPGLPQLFVAHSEIFDLQTPPQLPGAVAVVVAMNDRVAARMRSFAEEVEVARLRQPIDTERFAPRGSLPDEPRTALLLSNTPNADRLTMIERACKEAGLELARLGGRGAQSTDPRAAIAAADIVIGYGRSILEAMASGRAAYVYDWNGGDGWVTRESYAGIEADGIGGRSGRIALDQASLAADLRRYDPAMGPVNHDIVIGHHRANVHTQELIGIIRGLGARSEPPRGPLEEMARLVRLEWRARAEVHALGHEIEHLRQVLEDSRAEGVRAWDRSREEIRVAEGAVRAGFESSLSWKLTRPLRAAMAALRGLLR